MGVGGGANFELYPENSRLTALDYNECFKQKFMKNINNFPNIEFDGYLTGCMEDMHQIEDNYFDAVLITHVLCSVMDVQKGLSEIRRVLKKVVENTIRTSILICCLIWSGWKVLFL